jgi:uncharacterized membrane protein
MKIMPEDHVQEHINLIAKHEQEFLSKRTVTERLGDRIASFVGSLTFVVIHVLIFAAWISWNTASLNHLRHFDPAPFPLLDTCVALEAILVASFILMRQSRMSRRAEERDHLMLQILLLAEKEITASLGMERRMAERLGLQKLADDREITQLSQHTSIEDVAQTIKESLPHE